MTLSKTKITAYAAAVFAAVTVGANSASAAIITWSNVTSATDADISTTGTLLEAANFGGADVTANGVLFEGITFPASLTFLTQNYNTNGTWASPGVGGNIDAMFTTFGSVSTLTGEGLTGLVSGQEYEIQVLAYASGGPASRTLTLGDGGTPASEITVTYGDANLVTGTFTADGTTQSMDWVENTGSNFVSGYQLRLVPEPASMALLSLGGLLIASRRRG